MTFDAVSFTEDFEALGPGSRNWLNPFARQALMFYHVRQAFGRF